MVHEVGAAGGEGEGGVLGGDTHCPSVDVEACGGQAVSGERGVRGGEAGSKMQFAGDVGGDVGEAGELADEVFLGASYASMRAPGQVDGGLDQSSASR